MGTDKGSKMEIVILNNTEEIIGRMEMMGYEVLKIDPSQSSFINPFEMEVSKPVGKNVIEKRIDENEGGVDQTLRELGFESVIDFLSCVSKINRDIPEIEERFQEWAENDGSKDGLVSVYLNLKNK